MPDILDILIYTYSVAHNEKWGGLTDSPIITCQKFCGSTLSVLYSIVINL